jgi:hypothetical protein
MMTVTLVRTSTPTGRTIYPRSGPSRVERVPQWHVTLSDGDRHLMSSRSMRDRDEAVHLANEVVGLTGAELKDRG